MLKFTTMKRLQYCIAAFALTTGVLITSCSDRGNSTDSGQTLNDTNRIDTRRNSSDTTNYLTKDSGNQSQDVIDPEPPQNSRY
jgi:hypothetical protein